MQSKENSVNVNRRYPLLEASMDLVEWLWQAQGDLETLTLQKLRQAFAETGSKAINIVHFSYNFHTKMVKPFLYYMLHLPSMLLSFSANASASRTFLVARNYLRVTWESSEHFRWALYVGLK